VADTSKWAPPVATSANYLTIYATAKLLIEKPSKSLEKTSHIPFNQQIPILTSLSFNL